MFGVGTQEIIVILIIALIVFGPKKLPEIGKALGQGLRELKKASRDIVESVKVDIDEEQELPKKAQTFELPKEYGVETEINKAETPKESEKNKEEAK